MGKRSVIVLVVATVVVAALGSLTALGMMRDPVDESELTMQPDFAREGIPMPIVDSAEDGGFQYLGDGEFITESGRTFYWRDGRFVNADGSLMELPPSSKEHLNSLGIYHQPNAEDLAEAARAAAETEARESTDTT
jgi:hypothetical protein